MGWPEKPKEFETAKVPKGKQWWQQTEYYDSTPRDLWNIKTFYERREMEMALEIATEGTFELRSFIPNSIWKKIGGKFDSDGKTKLKPKKMTKLPKFELKYKRCHLNIERLNKIIKQMPPEGKLYSKAWLWPIFDSLGEKLGSRDASEILNIKNAPEQDKALIDRCLQMAKKFSERIDHEYKYKFFNSIDYYDDFLLKLVCENELLLRKRDGE